MRVVIRMDNKNIIAAVAFLIVIVAVGYIFYVMPQLTQPSVSQNMTTATTTALIGNITQTTTIPQSPTFNFSDFVLPGFYISENEASSLIGPGGIYSRHVIFSGLKVLNITASQPNTIINSTSLPSNYTLNASSVQNLTQAALPPVHILPDITTNTTFMANTVNWGYNVEYNSSKGTLQEDVFVNDTNIPYKKYFGIMDSITTNNTYNALFFTKNASAENFSGILYSAEGVENVPALDIPNGVSPSSKAELFLGYGYNKTALITIFLPKNADFINATQIAAVVSNDLSR